MTLNTRNKILLAVFILAITFIICTAAITIVSLVKGSTVVPTATSRLYTIPESIPLLNYNFTAAFLSAGILVLYTAVTICLVYINFEKTQSTEIIYFTMFLAGSMLEGIRIWLPAFNIWVAYSTVYIILGRILFFGRMLSTLSLIFLVLLSINQDAHQDADKNAFIIMAAAGVFAWMIPIDTMTIPSNCAVRFGYEKLFVTLSCICLVTVFLAMRHQGTTLGSKEYKTAANGYIVLVAGYIMLSQTDAILPLAAGAILLISGTGVFLRNLHKYHMWK